jgi:hypothetical protein
MVIWTVIEKLFDISKVLFLTTLITYVGYTFQDNINTINDQKIKIADMNEEYYILRHEYDRSIVLLKRDNYTMYRKLQYASKKNIRFI